MTVGPKGDRSLTRCASIRSTLRHTEVHITMRASRTKPGLMPVPRMVTPCSRASASKRSAHAGSLAHGYASVSAIEMTFEPAITQGSTWAVISLRLLCVLMHTTSGRSASTASWSVVIRTSHSQPSSSPTAIPTLAGFVTIAPTSSTSPGLSSRYRSSPCPIIPVPHTATLIMQASFATGHTRHLCIPHATPSVAHSARRLQ